MLKRMSREGTVHLTIICNTIISLGYFPAQWIVKKVIIIPKPSKLLEDVRSYRLISLLTVNNEQNLQESCAQEIMPDSERKLNPPCPSVWVSTETIHHWTSTSNYREHKQHFPKNSTALLCSYTSNKHLTKYGTQASCSKLEQSFPMHSTHH